MAESTSRGIFLQIKTVCKYLDATVESRCITEGEEILNARHIILLGIIAIKWPNIEIFGSCLQTSAMKSFPHEIKGKFVVMNKSVFTIKDFVCSCKAGLSGKCKHIAAVLLKCTRSDINSLEKLSTTDVTCYWTQKKKTLLTEYEAKPLLNSQCFSLKAIENYSLPASDREICIKVLTETCKESSLAVHLKGRNTMRGEKPTAETSDDSVLNNILSLAETSQFLFKLNLNVNEDNLRSCCKNILSVLKNTSIINIAKNATQGSSIWEEERRLRITGTKCYSLYTYKQDNWDRKAETFFWPKKFSNKYTLHGHKYEQEALEDYKFKNRYEVYQTGLIVCQQYPWLAYSPDGIVISNGQPSRLLEIKCPYQGLHCSSIEFVHKCPYLTVSLEEGLRLKKKHSYYAQVQFGMALLNLGVCDFVIYSVASKSFLNITVPFDENFAKDLIFNASAKYFNNLLHVICTKTEQY